MNISTDVPAVRLRRTGDQPLQSGQLVVYWMTAFRRTRYNFALEYARDAAAELEVPLLILEPLRIRYRWASVRMHQFVIEGMRDNLAACQQAGASYYPYVEPVAGEGSGLIAELAKRACMIVTDDFPCFFHPKMIALAARSLPCPLIAVDSNCLMPLRAPQRTFTVAHSYRRHMQKELPKHLEDMPEAEPLRSRVAKALPKLKPLPPAVRKQWPIADLTQLLAPGGLDALSIDQSVPAAPIPGGAVEADRRLTRFLDQRLERYSHDRNVPDLQGSSELSPHLHFGHIGPHEVFSRLMEQQAWTPGKLQKPNGKVNGFWGVDANAEAFLDQLCTWREIGFNMCVREPNYQRLTSLPDWTQKTIDQHSQDDREYIYTLQQFEQAQTHDPIWNAAQRQLVREGRIHNYLRMLWGKKILHWTANVQDALDIMIHLNNKYALDGRDPNSYSGIFWVLGRYDRAWGPERPIFGKIRYMTSENTAKKHALKEYLRRYAATGELPLE